MVCRASRISRKDLSQPCYLASAYIEPVACSQCHHLRMFMARRRERGLTFNLRQETQLVVNGKMFQLTHSAYDIAGSMALTLAHDVGKVRMP